MFLDLIRRSTRKATSGSTASKQVPSVKNAHLRKAQSNIMKAMEPTLAKCLRDNLVLVDPNTNKVFHVAELRQAWKEGQYIRGPKQWRLRREV